MDFDEMDRNFGGMRVERITLKFMTPTSIERDDRPVGDIDFLTLLCNLIRRIGLLAYSHCGEEFNGRPLLEKIEDIVTVESKLSFRD